MVSKDMQLAVFFIVATISSLLVDATPAKFNRTARCDITAIGDFTVTGNITIKAEEGQDFVTIESVFDMLPDDADSQQFGIHIHDYGILSDDGTDAGGHYNPFGEIHGCYDEANPTNEDRKVGDLGNVIKGSGATGTYSASRNTMVKLEGSESVLGRAIILHRDPDNCVRLEGPDGDLSAGARIGQCIIGLVENLPLEEDGDQNVIHVVGAAVACLLGLACVFALFYYYKVRKTQSEYTLEPKLDGMNETLSDETLNKV